MQRPRNARQRAAKKPPKAAKPAPAPAPAPEPPPAQEPSWPSTAAIDAAIEQAVGLYWPRDAMFIEHILDAVGMVRATKPAEEWALLLTLVRKRIDVAVKERRIERELDQWRPVK